MTSVLGVSSEGELSLDEGASLSSVELTLAQTLCFPSLLAGPVSVGKATPCPRFLVLLVKAIEVTGRPGSWRSLTWTNGGARARASSACNSRVAEAPACVTGRGISDHCCACQRDFSLMTCT